MNHMDVEFGGHRWKLLPGGGCDWPARQTLLVADLHLGKATTFRRHGIPVPTGSTAATLDHAARMLEQTAARTLIILGDLIHARSSLSPDVIEQFKRFIERHDHLAVQLVEGNHDRGSRRRLADLPIQLLGETETIEGITLQHAPTETAPPQPTLCGHLHPAVKLPPQHNLPGKLPCFWHQPTQLILPALGRFTGTATIRPGPADRVYALAPPHVLDVTGLLRSKNLKANNV